jgi:hypothetical protein
MVEKIFWTPDLGEASLILHSIRQFDSRFGTLSSGRRGATHPSGALSTEKNAPQPAKLNLPNKYL